MQMVMPLGGQITTPYLKQGDIVLFFDDGEVSELTAHVTKYSMYAACNDSGNEYLIMDSIVDYWKSDKDILVSSQKVVHTGQSFMRKSTVIWYLCVQWRDGSTSWQALKYLKESHPVETSDYVVAKEIYHKSAFNFWVKSVMKKRLSIIYIVKKITLDALRRRIRLVLSSLNQLCSHMCWIRRWRVRTDQRRPTSNRGSWVINSKLPENN